MRLALEASPQCRISGEIARKDLDGDRPVEASVFGFVDLTHPPGPEGLQDLVRAKACPRRQRHTAALPGVMLRAGYYSRFGLAANPRWLRPG